MTRDYDQPTPDWHAEPKPWCPECCVPASACGCPTGEQIHEEHIVRGAE